MSTPIAQRTYTNQEKITAVTAALTTNPDHPLSIESQRAAHHALGHTLNRGTLFNWIRQFRETIQSSIPKQSTTLDIIEDTYTKTFNYWQSITDSAAAELLKPERAQKAGYKELSWTLAVGTDKLDKMLGIRPSTRDKLAQLEHTLLGTSYTVDDWLDEAIHAAQQLKQAQYTQLDTTATSPQSTE